MIKYNEEEILEHLKIICSEENEDLFRENNDDRLKIKIKFLNLKEKNDKIIKLLDDPEFTKFLNCPLQKLSMLYWSTTYSVESRF